MKTIIEMRAARSFKDESVQIDFVRPESDELTKLTPEEYEVCKQEAKALFDLLANNLGMATMCELKELFDIVPRSSGIE